MRLYSRKNKEDLFDIFNIDISVPRIKYGTQPGNTWGNDYPTKVIDIHFNTKFVYRKDITYWYFELTLLGFGVSVKLNKLDINYMQPHDVDITINFHDGTQIQTKVDWKTIKLLKSKHKISAVEQAYNYTLLQTNKINLENSTVK